MLVAGLIRCPGSGMRILLVTLVGLVSAALGDGVSIVVPNDLEGTEGNGTDRYPFSIRFIDGSTRYQQVYDQSQFLRTPASGFVTTIRFRIDSSGYSFGGTLPNIQINLSTIVKPPDGLSTNFDENIGADDTVVFGPGPLTIQAAFAGT